MTRNFLKCFLLAMGMLFISCSQNGSIDKASFLADNTVRLEINGECQFSYIPGTCQMAYNAKRCEFRVHTDTMLDYFTITLDKVPSNPGTQVQARIAWSTVSGEQTKENITLNAIRVVGDVIWLCDESGRNAAVVRTLE